jgi:ABC-2 type transport system permease protein
MKRKLVTLGLVFRMQLISMRWFWRSALVNGFLIPMFMLMLWKILLSQTMSTDDTVYFLAGNVVVGLLFGNMGQTTSRLSWLRETGALDYYATLPIGKTCLIVAVILAFLVMALPGMLIALAIGALWLGAPIHPHPALALALLLGTLSLSTLGAVLGAYSRSPEQSAVLQPLITLGLTVLSPVLIPAERLPKILQWTSYLVPTTYATRAVRYALQAQLDSSFWLNLGVLALFSGVALGLVIRRLDWRA